MRAQLWSRVGDGRMSRAGPRYLPSLNLKASSQVTYGVEVVSMILGPGILNSE